MAVEQAIIALVVQGEAEVTAEADRIVVKLDSVREAGKRAEDAAKAAETAAKEAEQASKELSSEISKTFRVLARAGRLAKKLAHGMGYDHDSRVGSAIDIISAGLSGAASGARLGSMFGPWGTLIGAVGGGIASEYGAYQHAKHRIEEHNRKLQEHEQKEHLKEREEQLTEELLRQVGLYKLDQRHFGPRQVP